MADGLKQHSHRDRERIVAALVPLIQRHMGRNLVALAVAGSFARGMDGAYSDIELMGFVKRPLKDDRAYVRFVFDGMLVDLWFLSRDEYLAEHKQKARIWPYTARSALLPLLNAPFVSELARMKPSVSPQDCLRALERFWPEVQEAAGKVLTAAANGSRDPLPFLYWQMMEKMCVALSYLNARPYTTRAAVFSEARSFPILPPSFGHLIIPPDCALEPAEIGRRALTGFEEMEALILARGLKVYERELDAFVSPLSGARRWRLKIGGLVSRAAKVGAAFKSKYAAHH